METARHMRYILIGNRKILVEQPDGDKYRKATEDIAVGQSVEGIRTEECVFAITNEGLLFGSSVGVETHITPSEFAETSSGIYTPHSVIGHAYITRLPSVKSGISAHHSAKGKVTTAKLGRAESGIITTHEAEGRKTQSRLTKASEGIGIGHKGETIYTTTPIFADGVTGIGTGENAEAKKVAVSKVGKAESGVSTGQNAEAYVEEPSTATILAGTYEGNTGIPSPQYFVINVPIAYTQDGGSDYTASIIEAEDNGINVMAWRDRPLREGELIAVVMTDQNNDLFVGTDDGLITVTANTPVTDEEYALFMTYFKPTTGVIPAGTYEGVDIAIDPTVLPSSLSITLPLSYSMDSTPLTASYLDIGSDDVSMSAVGVRSYVPEDLDLIGWAFMGQGWVFGLMTDNGTITVTADTTVPIAHYNLFFTLFQPTN